MTRAAERRIVALMALVQLIATADFAVVSVALPSIGASLGIAPALLSWVLVANILVYAGALIVCGKLVDRFGQRRALLVGLGVFGAGSVLAALAPGFGLLLAARVGQGLAAALLAPAAFSLINAFLPEGAPRRRALGVFGVTQGASLIIGLLGGGLVVTAFGWRGVFLINLPLIAAAIALTLASLPRIAARAHEPVDVVGAVVSTAALVLLVGGISLLGRPGAVARLPLAMLAAALVLLALFVAIERRVAAPLVPRAIPRRPNYAVSAGVLLLFLAGVGGVFVLMQLYMQRVLGFSAAAGGLGSMPYALAVIAGGQAAPTLLARLGPRTLALAAGGSNMAGFVWLAASAGLPYAASMAPGMMLCAAGSVTAFIALMHLATAGLEPAEQGVGTALLFTCQQVGTGCGAAVTAMLLRPGAGDMLTAETFRLPFAALAATIAIALVLIALGLDAGKVHPLERTVS